MSREYPAHPIVGIGVAVLRPGRGAAPGAPATASATAGKAPTDAAAPLAK